MKAPPLLIAIRKRIKGARKRLEVVETLGLLQVLGLDTWKGELRSEALDLVTELLDLVVRLGARGGGDFDEVFEELGAGILLQLQGELDGTVQEGSHGLDVFLGHVTGSQGGGTETDTSGDLGRGVTRNGVLWRKTSTRVMEGVMVESHC